MSVMNWFFSTASDMYGNWCVVLDVEYTHVAGALCGVREDEVMIDWILSYLLRCLRLWSAGRD